MTNAIFSVIPLRDIHDIDVTTSKGRRFIVDIYQNESGFDSEVTILDGTSINPVSCVCKTPAIKLSAIDNFAAAINLIKSYLLERDPKDAIKDIHNPCNTPFITEAEQNDLLSQQDTY